MTCILTYIYCAGVTVLLSLTVFMNIVSELMPITSDAVPLIGKQTPPGKHYTSHIMPPPTLLGELSMCLTFTSILEQDQGYEGPQSLHNHGQGLY